MKPPQAPQAPQALQPCSRFLCSANSKTCRQPSSGGVGRAPPQPARRRRRCWVSTPVPQGRSVAVPCRHAPRHPPRRPQRSGKPPGVVSRGGGESSRACIHSKTLQCAKGPSAPAGCLRQAMATVPRGKPLAAGVAAFWERANRAQAMREETLRVPGDRLARPQSTKPPQLLQTRDFNGAPV